MPKFPIVGMQFRPSEGIPAPTIMSLLPPGAPLYLVREPSNPHDENAIQVWIRNTAEVIPESLDDIREACVTKDGQAYECPPLDEPLMLGFIKAATLSEEVQGSDVLAPRIDEMVASGIISSAEEIPCALVYGESGRPALTILTGATGGEEAPSPEFEADAEFLETYGSEEEEEEDEDGDEDSSDDSSDPELETSDLEFGEEPN